MHHNFKVAWSPTSEVHPGSDAAVSVTNFTREEQEALEDRWTWIRFQFLPGGAFGIWALATEWPTANPVWMVALTIFTAYCFFCWTSCFHETAHQTLSASRWPSIWIGRAIGTLMVVPYSVYRESHIRHHAYLNKPHDWELWPYSDPKCSLTFRRIFVWFDFFFGAFAAMITYGRIFFHKDSPLTDKKLRRTIWLEYAACVIFWSTVFGTAACFEGGLMAVTRGWLIPYMLAGIYQSARKFTEHLGMASYDPMQGTRTVVGRNWITKLCTYLNFDIFIHGPHHRHPRVAHRKLRELMHEYVEKAPALQYPMFPNYYQALRDTAPYLFKNPGVGMNAGAPAPHQEKTTTQNFVSDVVEEVLATEDLQVSAAAN